MATVTITYVTSPPTVTAGVTQTATVAVNIPAGIDWTQMYRNIVQAGGANFVNTAGTNVFIPLAEIVQITNP
jgi:hypothetical protein